MKNLLCIFLYSTSLFLRALSIVVQASQETYPRTGSTLQACVTDASTGEPIGKVKVIIIGSNRSAITARSDGFVFRGLRAGEKLLPFLPSIGASFEF